jgi:acyl phosphate:glycerol-3-phosphate acyltransferase
MATAVLLVAFAYLCGSIPTGVLLSNLRGLDPRDVGSGNIGATNVLRTAGPALGFLTLVGDAAKGWVPVALVIRAGQGEDVVALVALAAFCGHLYSCFLRLRGGKGVATALGVLIGLAPGVMALVVPLFVVIAALSRYVSLASMLSAAVTPPLLFSLGYGLPTVAAASIMAVLIAVRHRDNIQRLRFGTEARIGENRTASRSSEVA